MIAESEYQIAASLLNCELATIKAVAQVESGGAGFLSNGDLTILFESFQMYKNLKALKIDPKPYLKSHPNLVTDSWVRNYGKYSEQWDRLHEAATINKEAAYKSASYGRFQVMGMYYDEVGFSSVFQMVDQYKKSEGEHLMGFVRQIRFRKLDKALQEKDWETFALKYNGEGYKENKYHIKLETAYKSFV